MAATLQVAEIKLTTKQRNELLVTVSHQLGDGDVTLRQVASMSDKDALALLRDADLDGECELWGYDGVGVAKQGKK